MFISKKDYDNLIVRIKQLEEKTTAHSFDFGSVDIGKLCKKLPEFVDKRVAAMLSKRKCVGKNSKKLINLQIKR